MLFISIAITLGLFLIPYGRYVAYPLLLISTLVHELGHGVAALLMGGEFDRFVMHWNGAGTAFWRGDVGAAGQGFVAAGGLVGPAVGAAVLLVLARKLGRARWTLIALGALLLLAEVMVVRNGFGLMFVGGFAAVCLGIGVMGSDRTSQLTLVFLAVQLGLSVHVRRHYLFMKSAGIDANGNNIPSDSQFMSNAMGLPYWFWGGLCAAFSAVALLAGAYYFLRPDGSAAAASRPSKPNKPT